MAAILITVRAHAANADPGSGLNFLPRAQYATLPTASAPLAGSFPATFDLSASFPRPGDQEKQSSCVGWAIAYLKDYQQELRQHWSLDLAIHQYSPAWIYNRSKRSASCNTPITFVQGLTTAQRIGIALLSDYPYDDPTDPTCSANGSSSAISNALGYKIFKWYRVSPLIAELKGDLLAGYPVLIAIVVGADFHRLGAAPYDNKRISARDSGHALVVVGYDDSRAAFKVINSWGTQWGDGGFGWISYDALQARVREAYIVDDDYSASGGPSAGAVHDVTLSGAPEFRGDVTVKAPRVIIKQGTVIRVHNGATFAIYADEIVVEGTAEIDGSGDPGSPGVPGAANPQGPWNSQGDDDYWRARHDIESNPNHPDIGGAGGTGGRGGDGAKIILSTHPVGGALEIVVAGGKGGRGGAGGPGRLIRNGRNYYCDGCMYDRPGQNGHDGADGNNGTIQYIK